MRKKILAMALSLALSLTLAVPSLAVSVTTIQTEYTGTITPDNGHGLSDAEFSEGLAFVRDVTSGKFNYIDTNGKLLVPKEYDCSWFTEGLAAVEKDGKYGYIDYNGNVVIPPTYDGAFYFSDGLAQVEKDGKYGYIDRTGKVVIPLTYDDAGSFSEGLAPVQKNEKWGYVNSAGKLIIPLSLEYDSVDSFSEGLAVVTKDEKSGYIDSTGKLVIPMNYDSAESFANGFAMVWRYELDDMYIVPKGGHIDRTGKVVVPLEYDMITNFSDGLARVEKFDLYGSGNVYTYVDTTGKLFAPQEYSCEEFSEGLVAASTLDAAGNYKQGFLDRTGKVVIPLDYDCVYDFSDGLAAVKKNEKWGYIDRTGRVVIPLKYDYAASFSEGLAAVKERTADGTYRYGYIDQTGKVELPLEYETAYSFSEGVASVRKGGQGYFIDTTGQVIGTLPSEEFGGVTFSDGVAIEPNRNDKLVIFKKVDTEQPSTPVTPSFVDVSAGAYYAAPVKWAVEKKITAGTSATTFSPDNTCTTAHILTFLWRAKGSPAPKGSDASVPAGQYYSDAANWALEQGLLDRFTADAPATRLATVTYLWKLAGSPAVTSGTSFTDVTGNAQAVAWAVKQGVTKGTSNTTFSPNATCTRGQIVTFLWRDLAE